MKYAIQRADGTVELREDSAPPAGAVLLDDTFITLVKQAISAGKILSIVNGSVVFLDPPPLSADDLAAEARMAQDAADARAAKQYAKLQALAAMTPAQVLAWVQANVTNLASAQDAIATLAVAVGVLARRL